MATKYVLRLVDPTHVSHEQTCVGRPTIEEGVIRGQMVVKEGQTEFMIIPRGDQMVIIFAIIEERILKPTLVQ